MGTVIDLVVKQLKEFKAEMTELKTEFVQLKNAVVHLSHTVETLISPVDAEAMESNLEEDTEAVIETPKDLTNQMSGAVTKPVLQDLSYLLTKSKERQPVDKS